MQSMGYKSVSQEPELEKVPRAKSLITQPRTERTEHREQSTKGRARTQSQDLENRQSSETKPKVLRQRLKPEPRAHSPEQRSKNREPEHRGAEPEQRAWNAKHR